MRNQYQAMQEEIYEGMQMSAGGKGGEDGDESKEDDAPGEDEETGGEEQKDPDGGEE